MLAFLADLLGGRSLGLSAGGAIGVTLEVLVILALLTDTGRTAPGCADVDLMRLLVAITSGGAVAALVATGELTAYRPTSSRNIQLSTTVGAGRGGTTCPPSPWTT